MCESDVYAVVDGGETLLMENVSWMEFDGDTILMRDTDGRERTVRGRLKCADLVQHRLVIEPAKAD
jgi:predicted RNA-binding protein